MDGFQIGGLILFGLLLVGRSLHLQLIAGEPVFAIGRGKQGLSRVIEIAFIVGAVLWTNAVLRYALHTDWRLLPSILDARLLPEQGWPWLGALLCTAGLVLLAVSFHTFGRSWRLGVADPSGLVTSGVFALSRNPFFVGFILYHVGTFLIYGTGVFLLFALLVIAGTRYQIAQEEQFLRARFGLEYAQYCRGTGRYVTWPPVFAAS